MTKKRSKKAKLMAISSGKGGVGKSNIATNLGISFANAGHKVCLFDADINLANINILLGLSPLYTLQHLFTENKSLDDIIIQGPSNMDIIAGASGVTEFTHLKKNQQQYLLNGLQELESNYDYLIIDTAAGVDDTVLNFLHAVPYLILTITREPTSLTDAFSLLKVLKKQGYNRTVLLIINMVSGRKMAKQIFTRFNEAVSKYLQLEVRLAGFIISDEMVSRAVEKQQALLEYAPNSSASICIESIAMRLLKVFEKSHPSETVLTDFFATLITQDSGPERIDDLLMKAGQLEETQAKELYELLKIRFNHVKQHTIAAENTLIKARSKNPHVSMTTHKLTQASFIDKGLKQAMQLAARIGK